MRILKTKLKNRVKKSKRKIDHLNQQPAKLTVYYYHIQKQSISNKIMMTSFDLSKTTQPQPSYNQFSHNQHHFNKFNHQANRGPSKFYHQSNKAPQFTRNELTINLTKNEPRLVIFNNKPQINSQAQSKPIQMQPRQQFVQQPNCNYNIDPTCIKFTFNNSKPQKVNNFHNHRNTAQPNRFKFFKPNLSTQLKLKAPYNTTQYIMYDYSKRRGPLKDQECPNEQQQFTDDWNMALNQQNAAQNVNFDLLANKINNSKLKEDDEDSMDMDQSKKSRSETDLSIYSGSQVNIKEEARCEDQLELSIQKFMSTSL